MKPNFNISGINVQIIEYHGNDELYMWAMGIKVFLVDDHNLLDIIQSSALTTPLKWLVTCRVAYNSLKGEYNLCNVVSMEVI